MNVVKPAAIIAAFVMQRHRAGKKIHGFIKQIFGVFLGSLDSLGNYVEFNGVVAVNFKRREKNQIADVFGRIAVFIQKPGVDIKLILMENVRVFPDIAF